MSKSKTEYPSPPVSANDITLIFPFRVRLGQAENEVIIEPGAGGAVLPTTVTYGLNEWDLTTQEQDEINVKLNVLLLTEWAKRVVRVEVR